MARPIRRIAVLGAGVMGAGIAAHAANAGIEVLLLDIVPPKGPTDEDRAKGLTEASPAFRNRFALKGLDNLKKSKPALLYTPKGIALITPGNIDDDLAKAAACDWVIEVAPEDLKIKRSLYDRLDPLLAETTIVSSNTSGLPIAQLLEGRSDRFRRNFLVTHFFNPVRYMRLLEIVAGPETDPLVVRDLTEFGERRMGKGIVVGKDTPNFVGNRIGVFSMMHAMHQAVTRSLPFELVDAVLGPATGRPKSAAFGTADLVGLDTLLHVADNCHDNLPGDPERGTFQAPSFVRDMVSRGWLGRKSAQGFYRMEGRGEKKTKLVLDPKTMEYRPTEKPKAASLLAAKGEDDPGARIRKVVAGDDDAGRFAWEVTAATLCYAAARIPEIANDVWSIDCAMRWGFNWELGPFETWDAIGVPESVARMKAEYRPVPANVEAMLAKGATSFYRRRHGILEMFDFATGDYAPVPIAPEIILLPSLADRSRVVKRNPGGWLYDIGDGVLALEFRTKMGTIDADLVAMMNDAVALAETDFVGLVVGGHADPYSAGANLMLLFMEAQAGNFGNVEKMVAGFQDACMRLRLSDKPVVAAPAGLCLGGGVEVSLGSDAIRASAELYMGLVEVGVGLLPAGGGCKEMLIRHFEGIPEGVDVDPLPFVKKAFETIGLAKIAGSAAEARSLGFLRPSDGITMSRDHLLFDAKQTVLALARQGYETPRERTDIKAPGRVTAAAFDVALHAMKAAGQVSDHDAKIGRKIAGILCGGDVPKGTALTERYLLDLEREAFLSLCGEEKTRERISHMLMKGKPLRN